MFFDSTILLIDPATLNPGTIYSTTAPHLKKQISKILAPA
jgi:hypothetical protein